MAKKRRIVISICTLKESLQETLAAVKRAERGLSIGPVYHLNFHDQNTLFNTLSLKRMELLSYLRKKGPMSARQLAKNLGRDYKNIYGDIKLLSRLELIITDKAGKYIVPWSDITIELSLAA